MASLILQLILRERRRDLLSIISDARDRREAAVQLVSAENSDFPTTVLHEREVQFAHLAFLPDHESSRFTAQVFIASEQREDVQSWTDGASFLDSIGDAIAKETRRIQEPASSNIISTNKSPFRKMRTLPS